MGKNELFVRQYLTVLVLCLAVLVTYYSFQACIMSGCAWCMIVINASIMYVYQLPLTNNDTQVHYLKARHCMNQGWIKNSLFNISSRCKELGNICRILDKCAMLRFISMHWDYSHICNYS